MGNKYNPDGSLKDGKKYKDKPDLPPVIMGDYLGRRFPGACCPDAKPTLRCDGKFRCEGCDKDCTTCNKCNY